MSKTILITGAGSGLGKGTAIGLAKNGHNVIATCENWPQVTALMEAADEAGVKLEVTKLDYLNKDDHETVVRKYADKVDIFVPNAATGQTGPIAEIPVDRVRQVFEVNVFATLELAQAFARVFAKKRQRDNHLYLFDCWFLYFSILGALLRIQTRIGSNRAIDA